MPGGHREAPWEMLFWDAELRTGALPGQLSLLSLFTEGRHEWGFVPLSTGQHSAHFLISSNGSCEMLITSFLPTYIRQALSPEPSSSPQPLVHPTPNAHS